MHQTRQQTVKTLPITRKGTKYVVRALSHQDESVPVLVAMRDMLRLARTKKEVKKLILQKMLKINGREVMDYHESIKLFNIFRAGKDYVLKLSPEKKFFLEETKDGKERICKVIGKKLIGKNKVQLNLHDGTNILGDKSVKVGDTLYLDLSNNIKKHLSLSKGKEAFVFSGKYAGKSGTIDGVSGNLILIKLDGKSTMLPSYEVIAQ